MEGNKKSKARKCRHFRHVRASALSRRREGDSTRAESQLSAFSQFGNVTRKSAVRCGRSSLIIRDHGFSPLAILFVPLGHSPSSRQAPWRGVCHHAITYYSICPTRSTKQPARAQLPRGQPPIRPSPATPDAACGQTALRPAIYRLPIDCGALRLFVDFGPSRQQTLSTAQPSPCVRSELGKSPCL
jgi:hypothetical protein